MSGGAFDALNGTAYAAKTHVRFDAGRSYDVRIVVNAARQTYSVYLAKATTGQEVAIALDYKFQPGAAASNLDVLASLAMSGSFTLSAAPRVS
jgi:hypothetical protein